MTGKGNISKTVKKIRFQKCESVHKSESSLHQESKNVNEHKPELFITHKNYYKIVETKPGKRKSRCGIMFFSAGFLHFG